MKASVVDLRYKMKDVLKALDREEAVEILYHGKLKGKILPVSSQKDIETTDHPYFNMAPREEKSVEETMEDLRGGRFNDI